MPPEEQLADCKLRRSLSTLQNEPPFAWQQTANTQGELGDSHAIPILIERLGSSDPANCHSIESALLKFGELAVAPLCAALQYPLYKSWQIRDKAAQLLGQTGSPHAIEPLCAAMKDDDVVGHRYATEALIKIGAPAEEALLTQLKNEQVKVRLHAAFALGKIGSKRATAALCEALNNNDGMVRSEAVKALGRIGDLSAIVWLCAALKDPDETVRNNADKALEGIDHQLSRTVAKTLPIAILIETQLSITQRIQALGALGVARYKNKDISLVRALGSVQAYCEYLLKRGDLSEIVLEQARAVITELQQQANRETLLRANNPDYSQENAELLRGVVGGGDDISSNEYLRASEAAPQAQQPEQHRSFFKPL